MIQTKTKQGSTYLEHWGIRSSGSITWAENLAFQSHFCRYHLDVRTAMEASLALWHYVSTSLIVGRVDFNDHTSLYGSIGVTVTFLLAIVAK